MKKTFITLFALLLGFGANAQNRFPKPDFESGYQYPELHYFVPNETFWIIIDIVLLTVMMSIVVWAAYKKLSRKPIVIVSAISILYFGFYRSGCVCSIGAIQNVALALADNTYALPLSVLLIFILPILFAFLFGRVFCAGVCPFGALQELINIKDIKLSRSVTSVLSIIPWIYLVFAILYAITRSSFIICRFDPFIGIFRLGGDIGLIMFGVMLLLMSLFIGRPFCRFLCPYGALLSLFSSVSIWKIQITNKTCISCELCHNACPADAIRPPYDNKLKEGRRQGVNRLLMYFVMLPLLIAAGAFLMRLAAPNLSRANKDVRLYDMVMAYEALPQEHPSLELEAFYGQGSSIDELTQKYKEVEQSFEFYATIAGALIGLIIGIKLIGLSVKRSRKQYEIDSSACVSCGRCFSYCPQNQSIEQQIISNLNADKE